MTSENSLVHGIVFVDSPMEPGLLEKLVGFFEDVRECDLHLDLVIDFSEVDAISDDCIITKLLRIREMLTSSNNRLILCGVKGETAKVFKVTGLSDFFEFMEDKEAASAALKKAD